MTFESTLLAVTWKPAPVCADGVPSKPIVGVQPAELTWLVQYTVATAGSVATKPVAVKNEPDVPAIVLPSADTALASESARLPSPLTPYAINSSRRSVMPAPSRQMNARCGVPKSRLSRRVAHLEQRIGIALIRRDERHFEVTEVGRQLASQGMAIRALAQQAENVVGDLQDEPTGTLAVACPVAIATFVLPRFVSAFIRRYPRVTLTISTTTGMVESLAERFDVVIHPAARQLPDSTMIARRLHVAPFVLVRAAGLGPALDDPMALTQCEVLGWEYLGSQTRWNLVHTDGRCLQVPVTPRLISDNLGVLR